MLQVEPVLQTTSRWNPYCFGRGLQSVENCWGAYPDKIGSTILVLSPINCSCYLQLFSNVMVALNADWWYVPLYSLIQANITTLRHQAPRCFDPRGHLWGDGNCGEEVAVQNEHQAYQCSVGYQTLADGEKTLDKVQSLIVTTLSHVKAVGLSQNVFFPIMDFKT